jgi:hypothetical protein
VLLDVPSTPQPLIPATAPKHIRNFATRPHEGLTTVRLRLVFNASWSKFRAREGASYLGAAALPAAAEPAMSAEPMSLPAAGVGAAGGGAISMTALFILSC